MSFKTEVERKCYYQEWRKKNKERLRVISKQYYQDNKEKIKAKAKEYNEKNREVINKYRRNSPKMKECKRRDYLKRKEYCNQKSREYYFSNKDQRMSDIRRWQEENPEKVKQYKRKNNNTERTKAIKYNHRALKRASGYKITEEDIDNMIKQQNNRCFYCDNELSKYHLDHIIPLSKGGEHKLYNLVFSCPHCNLSKNNCNPEIFVNKILSGVI